MIGLCLKWHAPGWYWNKRAWFISFPVKFQDGYCMAGITILGFTLAAEWNFQ